MTMINRVAALIQSSLNTMTHQNIKTYVVMKMLLLLWVNHNQIEPPAKVQFSLLPVYVDKTRPSAVTLRSSYDLSRTAGCMSVLLSVFQRFCKKRLWHNEQAYGQVQNLLD